MEPFCSRHGALKGVMIPPMAAKSEKSKILNFVGLFGTRDQGETIPGEILREKFWDLQGAKNQIWVLQGAKNQILRLSGLFKTWGCFYRLPHEILRILTKGEVLGPSGCQKPYFGCQKQYFGLIFDGFFMVFHI